MQLSIASEISRTDLSGSFFEVCDEARWQLTVADNGVGFRKKICGESLRSSNGARLARKINVQDWVYQLRNVWYFS